MPDEQPRSYRVGMTFHETYPFDRSRVATIVQSVHDLLQQQPDDHLVSRDQIERANPSFRAKAARASYPNWAVATGLLQKETSKLTLTSFGHATREFDPALQRRDTGWLMHYHLCSPNGPGPCYWNEMFTDVLRPGHIVNRNSVIQAISDFSERTGGIVLKPRAAREAAAALINSYLPTGGLERLDLLEAALGSSQLSVSFAPEAVSTSGFGFALVDYWERTRPSRLTLNLEDLLSEGGIARLLFLDREMLYRHLHAIERLGVIEVFRSAHPHQIVRRWSEASSELVRRDLLVRMYADDSA